MAGVQNDQLGIAGIVDNVIAGCGHGFGHALAVIDIHLTAIGFNKTALARLAFFR